MRIRTPIDLGAAIRDRRMTLDLDQKPWRPRSGVSRQGIVDVEKGKPRGPPYLASCGRSRRNPSAADDQEITKQRAASGRY